jgi:hypothetical protein
VTELFLRALGYALIPGAVMIAFRGLAKRYPASQGADATASPKHVAPPGYATYSLGVLVAGLLIAALAAALFSALGQHIASSGDCALGCFGASFIVFFLPWFPAGMVIVGLIAEFVFARIAPDRLADWKRYDEVRTGVNWQRLERRLYLGVAVFTSIITWLGLHYFVRFGAQVTELHPFFALQPIRLPHTSIDSIRVYDRVRLRNGGYKADRGMIITWRSGERLRSQGTLYSWRPWDTDSLALRFSQQLGTPTRMGGPDR